MDGEAADAVVALGQLVSIVQSALEDKDVDTGEHIKIVDAARVAKREIEQILDAAGIDDADPR